MNTQVKKPTYVPETIECDGITIKLDPIPGMLRAVHECRNKGSDDVLCLVKWTYTTYSGVPHAIIQYARFSAPTYDFREPEQVDAEVELLIERLFASVVDEIAARTDAAHASMEVSNYDNDIKLRMNMLGKLGFVIDEIGDGEITLAIELRNNG